MVVIGTTTMLAYEALAHDIRSRSIAIIDRSPATANALHGAVYAQRTGLRVLLIFAASSALPAAPGAGPSMDPKAFNAHAVLQAAGFNTLLAVDSKTALQTLGCAIDATRHGGCAVLLLPMNVQTGPADGPGPDGPREPYEAPVMQRMKARPAARSRPQRPSSPTAASRCSLSGSARTVPAPGTRSSNWQRKSAR